MVVGLPPLVGGVAVRSLENLGLLDRAFNWLDRPSRWLLRATVPLGLLVMAVPRPQLPLLSVIEELGLLGVLTVLLALALLAWRRGRRDALTLVAAVSPFVWVATAALCWDTALAP